MGMKAFGMSRSDIGMMQQGQVCGASVAAQVIGPHANATTSANFYMYIYKVVLCKKRHSHDWGACPYAHEKEKARRRDPQTCNYSSCICPNASKGECPNGLDCPYAHTLFEYWLHPSRFRTQMCRSGSDCKRALCFFAHSAEELRQPIKPMSFDNALNAALPSLSAATVVGAMLGGPVQQYRRFSETANGYGSAGDLTSWPLAVEDRSSGSFTSTCSLVTPGGSSILPMVTGNAAATIVSCPEPVFGDNLSAITCNNGGGSPLFVLSANDGMLGPAVNPPDFAMLQQHELQQKVAVNQLKMQELALVLQQENVRATLAQMGQVNGVANAGMTNMADISIAASMGMAGAHLGYGVAQMHAAPLPLPEACNSGITESARLNLLS